MQQETQLSEPEATAVRELSFDEILLVGGAGDDPFPNVHR